MEDEICNVIQLRQGQHPCFVQVNRGGQRTCGPFWSWSTRNWIDPGSTVPTTSFLDKFSKALDIPLILCPSKGEEYHIAFEKGLAEAKKRGAEIAGFGDIDIENNRQWCEARCENAGIKAEFPFGSKAAAQSSKKLLIRDSAASSSL